MNQLAPVIKRVGSPVLLACDRIGISKVARRVNSCRNRMKLDDNEQARTCSLSSNVTRFRHEFGFLDSTAMEPL
eukprot:gene27369-biopygen10398